MHPINNNTTPGESRPASVAPARPATGPHLTGTAALQQTMSNYASNAAQQVFVASHSGSNAIDVVRRFRLIALCVFHGRI